MKGLLFALSTFLIVSIVVFSSGKTKDNEKAGYYFVQAKYFQQLSAFEQKLQKLQTQTTTLSAASLSNVKASFVETRLSYKKLEPILTRRANQAVLDYVNGAPLPKLEKNVAEINVIEPSGLQILDELIFGDDPIAEKEKINKLTSELIHQFKRIKQSEIRYPLTDRIVFEAVRQEFVRIYTLGLTGFDSPLSGNSIEEAKVALQSSYEHLLPYKKQLIQVKFSYTELLYNSFEKGIDYLEKNNNFDEFDRLLFLKEIINPLFDLTYRAHKALGIEFVWETSPSFISPFNYNATNLFAENFLNPYAYLLLDEKTNNKKVFELGKTLFFDPILSKNNKRACASCHQPEKGFTDGAKKSLAFDFNGTLTRNAPTILNAVYSAKYFHDLRSESLQNQIENVLVSKKEFSTSYDEIIAKLNQSPEYKKRFAEAFVSLKLGSKSINSSTIAMAIESYEKEISGFNSAFDHYVRGESTQLNPSAYRGYNLFMGKAVCGTCHFAPIFNGSVPPFYDDAESEVLGVPSSTDTIHPKLDEDRGRMMSGLVSQKSEIYDHSFKTPTVRNIELTGPYMHNGVYETLEEVVDFYQKGGGAGIGINVPNQTLPFDKLELTKQDVNDIIAFMKSLTDTTDLNSIPDRLPSFPDKPNWNNRKIGGEY